ncbi:MAG: type IV pilus twitching motility protein PilT [Candidatus Omnitrophota bacterium]
MVEINHILEMCVHRNASDIHLCVDKPPVLRINGEIENVGNEPLTAFDTERLAKSITADDHQGKLRQHGTVEFGLAFGDVARFRVSVFKQKGVHSLCLRMIPSRLYSFDDIGIPDIVKTLLNKPRGLVLVTGPTGCGKTTTLATMIDCINVHRAAHIITIEDPIEYYHTHKKSIISQREIGVDVPSFSDAVIRSLRQNPDVILVGEMRDLATIEAAILAAETGHLVFATLHTTSAAKTVDRIIEVFPVTQQEQIRVQLSTSIIAIICQQLLVRADSSSRIACFEIMITTTSIQNLIREKKTYSITSDIQTGGKYGMKTFDAFLAELYKKGSITYETALEKAFDPEHFGLQFKEEYKDK